MTLFDRVLAWLARYIASNGNKQYIWIIKRTWTFLSVFGCLHLRHAWVGEHCCATIIRHTSTYKWLPSIPSFIYKSAITLPSPHNHDLSAAYILICCCVDTATQFVRASPIGHAWRIYIYILEVSCFGGEVCIGDIDTWMHVNNYIWEIFFLSNWLSWHIFDGFETVTINRSTDTARKYIFDQNDPGSSIARDGWSMEVLLNKVGWWSCMCCVSIAPSHLRASIRGVSLNPSAKIISLRRPWCKVYFITDKLICGSIEMPIEALRVTNLSDEPAFCTKQRAGCRAPSVPHSKWRPRSKIDDAWSWHVDADSSATSPVGDLCQGVAAEALI